MSIRIVLVDDHQLMREGLRSLLAAEDDMLVVADAGDGRAALRLARELRPQVVIMDISMPELNGVEAARQLQAEHPGIAVVALSTHSSDRLVVEMFRAGASGYVPKDAAFDELVRAVRSVASGRKYVSPKVAAAVLDALSNPAETTSAFAVLTPRERQVLQLLAEGKSTKEIAHSLRVSPRTVDVHRKNTMDKLCLSSVAELTRYAIREGLVSVDT